MQLTKKDIIIYDVKQALYKLRRGLDAWKAFLITIVLIIMFGILAGGLVTKSATIAQLRGRNAGFDAANRALVIENDQLKNRQFTLTVDNKSKSIVISDLPRLPSINNTEAPTK